jgi:hypothetical protein
MRLTIAMVRCMYIQLPARAYPENTVTTINKADDSIYRITTTYGYISTKNDVASSLLHSYISRALVLSAASRVCYCMYILLLSCDHQTTLPP